MNSHYTPTRRENRILNVDEDAKKLDGSFTAGNVKWFSHSGKFFNSFLKI